MCGVSIYTNCLKTLLKNTNKQSNFLSTKLYENYWIRYVILSENKYLFWVLLFSVCIRYLFFERIIEHLIFMVHEASILHWIRSDIPSVFFNALQMWLSQSIRDSNIREKSIDFLYNEGLHFPNTRIPLS